MVEAADMLIANTDIEAKQLIELYDADPGRVEVVHPGVDLDVFRPVATRPRRAPGSGCRPTPTCCSSPAGSSRSRRPTCCCTRSPSCSTASPARRAALVVPVVGGPSGSGLDKPQALADLAAEPRHRRRRPVRAAGLAGRARPLVRRGHRGRRPVLQRVVRPGRGRGAGHRHPGRRRRRRRAHHRGPRRPQRPARRRPRPARLGRRADPGPRRPATCGCGSRPARSSRRGCSPGTPPPTGPSRSTSAPRAAALARAG